MEVHGVGAQDQHFFPSPNRWTNREGELGYLTIPKELGNGGSTRLGGSLRVSQVLLQQFGTLRNGIHTLSNDDGQVTNFAHNLGSTWITSK
jgi:hypothetical protein